MQPRSFWGSYYMNRSFLTRFAWISIAAAVATILLKSGAYMLTGSVGLLSDAIESLVNLIGGIMALAMLTVAARPADEEHQHGHSKAEYFSSVVEGTLILAAAASIALAATERLISPRPLEQIGVGLAISIGASFINLCVAILLVRAGKKYNSITLEANAQHLFTDVWTSVGVVAGVGAVALTGWQRLDPLVAILVAANIVWTGVGIVKRSISGLMDAALTPEDLNAVKKVLQTHEAEGIQFHALRSRQAGSRKFVTVHVLVPGDWSVQRGHQLVDRIESEIRTVLPDSIITTHLEPLEDSASWDDEPLERKSSDSL